MAEDVIREPIGKSMRIRRAVEADLGEMLDLVKAVIAPGATLPYLEVTDEDDIRAQWFGGGQSPWVAVVDSRICGMYTLGANHTGRGSHVASATYAVGPWAQGRGIGRAIVQHSLEQAREAGYLAMQFNYVVSSNRVAIALYEKLGFTIVGTLPKAFRHEKLGLVDAHVMYRFL